MAHSPWFYSNFLSSDSSYVCISKKTKYTIYSLLSSVMKTLIFQVQSAPLVMIILLRLRMAILATLVIARVRQSAHAVRKEDGTLGEKQHIVRSVLRQLLLCNFLMENIMQALILIMEFCKFSLYDVSYRA